MPALLNGVSLTPLDREGLAGLSIDPGDYVDFLEPNNVIVQLPRPHWVKLQFNRVYWPSGPMDFSSARFVVSTAQLNQIRSVIPQSSSPIKPVTLHLFDGATPGVDLKGLYLCPPRPVDKDPRFGWWVITLVDDRWFWWHHAEQFSFTSGSTSYADLFGQYAAILGISLIVDPVDAGYGKPSPDMAADYRPVPMLMDMALRSCQQVLTRQFNGTYRTWNVSNAFKAFDLLVASPPRPVEAGGLIEIRPSISPDKALLPRKCRFIFPRKVDGTFNGDGAYVVEQPLSTLQQWLGALANEPTIQADQVIVTGHAADYTGSTLNNGAELATYARTYAVDFYQWAVAQADVQFQGVTGFTIDGTINHVWFDLGPTPRNLVVTRLCRGQSRLGYTNVMGDSSAGSFPPGVVPGPYPPLPPNSGGGGGTTVVVPWYLTTRETDFVPTILQTIVLEVHHPDGYKLMTGGAPGIATLFFESATTTQAGKVDLAKQTWSGTKRTLSRFASIGVDGTPNTNPTYAWLSSDEVDAVTAEHIYDAGTFELRLEGTSMVAGLIWRLQDSAAPYMELEMDDPSEHVDIKLKNNAETLTGYTSPATSDVGLGPKVTSGLTITKGTVPNDRAVFWYTAAAGWATAASPTEGDIAYYDGGTATWKYVTPGASAGSILWEDGSDWKALVPGGMGDLLYFNGTTWKTVSASSAGDLVYFDGTDWIIRTASAAGDMLYFDGTDWLIVSAATAADGDVLTWDDTNSKPVWSALP